MLQKSTSAGPNLQQLNLNFPAPARAIDRVPTSTARGLLKVKRMRPGVVYEAPASYGGKWVAVWAGINPQRKSENVWDILYQQVS